MVKHYHQPCIACTILPTLELKFVIHQGSFVIQEVADRERLVGPAVNLVHRLLKNEISQQTGMRGYLFVTDAAAASLALPSQAGQPYQEHYADVGAVAGTVIDITAGAATPGRSS